MILAGEVGDGISHQEGADIAHKSIDRRLHHPDMAVDAADHQLIPPPFGHQLGQR